MSFDKNINDDESFWGDGEIFGKSDQIMFANRPFKNYIQENIVELTVAVNTIYNNHTTKIIQKKITHVFTNIISFMGTSTVFNGNIKWKIEDSAALFNFILNSDRIMCKIKPYVMNRSDILSNTKDILENLPDTVVSPKIWITIDTFEMLLMRKMTARIHKIESKKIAPPTDTKIYKKITSIGPIMKLDHHTVKILHSSTHSLSTAVAVTVSDKNVTVNVPGIGDVKIKWMKISDMFNLKGNDVYCDKKMNHFLKKMKTSIFYFSTKENGELVNFLVSAIIAIKFNNHKTSQIDTLNVVTGSTVVYKSPKKDAAFDLFQKEFGSSQDNIFYPLTKYNFVHVVGKEPETKPYISMMGGFYNIENLISDKSYKSERKKIETKSFDMDVIIGTDGKKCFFNESCWYENEEKYWEKVSKFCNMEKYSANSRYRTLKNIKVCVFLSLAIKNIEIVGRYIQLYKEDTKRANKYISKIKAVQKCCWEVVCFIEEYRKESMERLKGMIQEYCKYLGCDFISNLVGIVVSLSITVRDIFLPFAKSQRSPSETFHHLCSICVKISTQMMKDIIN